MNKQSCWCVVSDEVIHLRNVWSKSWLGLTKQLCLYCMILFAYALRVTWFSNKTTRITNQSTFRWYRRCWPPLWLPHRSPDGDRVGHLLDDLIKGVVQDVNLSREGVVEEQNAGTGHTVAPGPIFWQKFPHQARQPPRTRPRTPSSCRSSSSSSCRSSTDRRLWNVLTLRVSRLSHSDRGLTHFLLQMDLL